MRVLRYVLLLLAALILSWFGASVGGSIADALGHDGFADAAGSGFEEATTGWKRGVAVGAASAGGIATLTGLLMLLPPRQQRRRRSGHWALGAIGGAGLGVAVAAAYIGLASFAAGLN